MIYISLRIFYFCFFFIFFNLSFASGNISNLSTVKFNNTDYLSLQRGASSFFENCAGCHSLKYTRYKSLAEGLFVNNTSKKDILSTFVQKNWAFDVINLNSNITSSLVTSDSIKWFGKIVPDLSLVTRFRGSNWVYTYLKSFYYDSSKPWKMSNTIFPDVAMPNVLISKQGLQEVVYKSDGVTIDHLVITKKGTMSVKGYDNFIYDLVNFLTFVGEPIKSERMKFGYILMPFLIVFSILTYYLKKEFWKDIDKS